MAGRLERLAGTMGAMECPDMDEAQLVGGKGFSTSLAVGLGFGLPGLAVLAGGLTLAIKDPVGLEGVSVRDGKAVRLSGTVRQPTRVEKALATATEVVQTTEPRADKPSSFVHKVGLRFADGTLMGIGKSMDHEQAQLLADTLREMVQRSGARIP